MVIAHRLVFRFPTDNGDTVLNGRFERLEGGWISLATSTWYPDASLMSACVAREERLQCKLCGYTAATAQGLAMHSRKKHKGQDG